jgi:hypothetical protein
MRAGKALVVVLTLLMGAVITISVYYMSVNGRYTATWISEHAVLILDTRTGEVTVKALLSADTPPAGVPAVKLVTVVPRSAERSRPDGR